MTQYEVRWCESSRVHNGHTWQDSLLFRWRCKGVTDIGSHDTPASNPEDLTTATGAKGEEPQALAYRAGVTAIASKAVDLAGLLGAILLPDAGDGLAYYDEKGARLVLDVKIGLTAAQVALVKEFLG